MPVSRCRAGLPANTDLVPERMALFSPGGVKMVVAILFGASLMTLCVAFPASILGVMVGFSGLELAADLP